MAHQGETTVTETVVQLLNEYGLSHMAEAIRVILNEATRTERSQGAGSRSARAHRQAPRLCPKPSERASGRSPSTFRRRAESASTRTLSSEVCVANGRKLS